ncbi:glycosyltransferase [Caulobacter sp. S45]|uniref:glycosyltransferase n=1 Tax=Caulobacter sp. S45 TaxID=1641861 RepID=UPI00131CA46B|nr:glycosyltransferase [Caulobacter sp. S45]
MRLAEDHEFLVLAYGDSPFLGDCLTSLKAQRASSRIRISTSTPSPYIDRVAQDHQVEVLVNPVRTGIGRDWNFALERAERRYVTLAHQDDLYRPAFLPETLALFEAHPEAGVCFTGYEQIDDCGRITWSKISLVKHGLERSIIGSKVRVNPARMRWFLSFGNPLPCSSVTLDMRRLDGFQFSETLSSNLDWDAWLRLCRGGMSFLHAPERLIGRRHNDLTETSRLIRDGRRRREDREMFRRTWAKPLDGAMAYVYSVSY